MSDTANPLLKPLTAKDMALPFNEIKPADYIPALHEAIIEAKANIEAIKSQKETSFENTILALEMASETVDRVSGIYFNLFSAEASTEHQALAQQISPIVSAFASDISLDDKLFQKIKPVAVGTISYCWHNQSPVVRS